MERRERQKEKQKREKEDQQKIEEGLKRNNKGLVIFSAVLVAGIAILLFALTIYADDSYFTLLIIVGISICLFGVLGLYEGLMIRHLLSKCPNCKAIHSVLLKVSDVQNKIYQCTECQIKFDYSKK